MISDHSPHTLRRFLAPSAFSGFFSGLVGLVSLGFSLYYFVINKSAISHSYQTFLTMPKDNTQQLALIDEAINNNSTIADSAIFMVWVIVGMLVYVAGEMIYRSFKGSKEFVDEMNHTAPQSRQSLIKEGVQHLVFRLLGIAGVYGLYKALLILLPPLVLNIYHLIRFDELWAVLLLLGGAFVFGALVVHWLTLCLRLLRYRLRVFGSIDS